MKKETAMRTVLAAAAFLFFFSALSELSASEPAKAGGTAKEPAKAGSTAKELAKAGGAAAQLPADYWKLPLSAQGKAPMDWGKDERSLDPRSCGKCHVEKLGEWSTSLHSKAFSPGLVGQLITEFAGNPGMCMRCHAPLAEQATVFKKAIAQGLGHDKTAQGLAAAGNSCAGCHLRDNRRYGPPKAGSGETGQSDPTAPHGGVLRTPDFEKSAFCKACHQFPPEFGTVNGKPLQNTYAEWEASPQAAAGTQCQACHMPDRKHLWRGIHDPEMVKSGLTASFKAAPGKARFELLNSGVGHAFPTYVTPRVVMRAVALDAGGAPVKGTETSYVIQRSVGAGNDGWYENFDTRLLPGRSAALEIPWGAAKRARMWLDVYPDDFYGKQVYPSLLEYLGGEAGDLIAKADGNAGKSSFRLFETDLTRPN